MDGAHDIVLETPVEVPPEELDTAQEDDFSRIDEAREAGLRISRSYDDERFTALIDEGDADAKEVARVQRLGRGSTRIVNESPSKGLQKNRSQSQDYSQLLSNLDSQSPVPPSPFKPRFDRTRAGGSLLKQKVELHHEMDGNGGRRAEIVPLKERLSEDKGIYTVIRAIQLLKSAKRDGSPVIVALAGPSGAGKSTFSRRLASIIPLLVISLDDYVIEERFQEQGKTDSPATTDFTLICKNLQGLQRGFDVQAPVFDFKLGRRTGYVTLSVPDSRVILVSGIYALQPSVRQYVDLSVAISGGAHFDLIKRIMKDTHMDSKARVSDAVFPMYKEYMEPDMETAHIRVRSHQNPFSGFLHNANYTLKSEREMELTELEERIKSVFGEEVTTRQTETTDLFLLPPGEDQEHCKNWIRMRRRDGHFSLVFEEYISDGPMLISPSMSFAVSVHMLGGLMTLGYQLGAIITRFSDVYECENVCIKSDYVDVLRRRFTQVESIDRDVCEKTAKALGLDGTYSPNTYIELLQLERLTMECTVDTRRVAMFKPWQTPETRDKPHTPSTLGGPFQDHAPSPSPLLPPRPTRTQDPLDIPSNLENLFERSPRASSLPIPIGSIAPNGSNGSNGLKASPRDRSRHRHSTPPPSNTFPGVSPNLETIIGSPSAPSRSPPAPQYLKQYLKQNGTPQMSQNMPDAIHHFASDPTARPAYFTGHGSSASSDSLVDLGNSSSGEVAALKAQLAMLLEMQEESVKQMSTFALLHMQRQNKERENCGQMGFTAGGSLKWVAASCAAAVVGVCVFRSTQPRG